MWARANGSLYRVGEEGSVATGPGRPPFAVTADGDLLLASAGNVLRLDMETRSDAPDGVMPTRPISLDPPELGGATWPTAIDVASDGSVWASWSRGTSMTAGETRLIRFHDGTWTDHSGADALGGLIDLTTDDNYICDITSGGGDDIWVGVCGAGGRGFGPGGLFRHTESGWERASVFAEAGRPDVLVSDVDEVATGGDDTKWALVWPGPTLAQHSDGAWAVYPWNETVPYDGPGLFLPSGDMFDVDSQGVLWALAGDGLGRADQLFSFDGETVRDYTAISPMSDVSVDREGRVWLAARGGLTVIDPTIAAPTPDLLPGVDLVTEEVAPGVYRVLNDGVRDLGWAGRDGRVHAGLDGGVVLSFTTDSPCDETHCVGYRLGEPETFSTRHQRLTVRLHEVGPNGTIWGYAFRQGDGSRDLRYWDQDGWVIVREQPGLGGVRPVFDIDGNVWAEWQTSMGDRTIPSRSRLARLTDEGWQRIRGFDSGQTDYFLEASPSGELVLFSDGDQVYQLTDSGLDALRDAADVPLERPWMIGLAEDGTELWTTPSGDQLGRFDGSTWEMTEFPPGFCPSGARFAPDGAVWVGSGGQGCSREPEFLRITGESSARFLDGALVTSFDIDAGGRVWALASDETGALDLFVVTPEALAAPG